MVSTTSKIFNFVRIDASEHFKSNIVRRKLSFIILILVFILNSCIYEEYRINKTHLADDWKMEIITPLFYGNWSLYHLLLEKEFSGPQDAYLSFITEKDSIYNISESSLREMTSVIDSFNFYIDGDDYLESAAIVIEVENDTKLDFYLQLRFYEKISMVEPDFTIHSAPFFSNGTSKDSIPLSQEQIEIFKAADRVEFSVSFSIPEKGISEPVNTDAEINFSILLIGKLNRKYE